MTFCKYPYHDQGIPPVSCPHDFQVNKVDQVITELPRNLSALEEVRCILILYHTLRKGFHTEAVLDSQKAHGLHLCEIHHLHHAPQWPNIVARLILSKEN